MFLPGFHSPVFSHSVLSVVTASSLLRGFPGALRKGVHTSARDGVSCSRLAGLQESAPRDWEPGWGRWEAGPRERAVVGTPEGGLGRRLGMEEGGVA